MDGWIRHGECNGCGRCCEVLAHPVQIRVRLPDLDPDYLRVRGIVRDRTSRAWLTGSLVSPCPELTSEKRCGLHDTGAKPAYCRDYPTKPEDIATYPCSYWFTRDAEAWGGQASPYPVRTTVR